MLTTEGTYPYFAGGVSTWAHALVSGMPEHHFDVVAVAPHPHVGRRFEVPPNTSVLTVPLWGAERVEEYLPGTEGAFTGARTTGRVIGAHFLPLIEHLVDQLVLSSGDAAGIGDSVTALAGLCGRYDLRKALRDERVWKLVMHHLSSHPLYRHASLESVIDLARSLYRYLMPLALPLPRADLSHSSAAAICALPCLVAKLRDGVPIILTEHGIYFRERVLQLVRDDTTTLRKVMFANFYRGVAQATYGHADVIVPVCTYNTTWEAELGVDDAQIRIIHNGVDPDLFEAAESDTTRPTVAFVGRIDPLKDILTLIAAAGLVRQAVGDVIFRLYGPDADEAYAAQCRRAVALAGLESVVIFEGPTNDPAGAYRDSDVVVMSSVSEGFPFSVIEAMMAARPVVATAVGGVSEALDDPDLMVSPRNPQALAAGLVRILGLSELDRRNLGLALRERAVQRFSQVQFLDGYTTLYEEMRARVA
ncbi:MAG: GT4 family glycosyltransferase PelF [Acidimicrobiales bacterium]